MTTENVPRPSQMSPGVGWGGAKSPLQGTAGVADVVGGGGGEAEKGLAVLSYFGFLKGCC